MMLTAFSVYDHKAEAYMPPFFFRSRGEAIRAFSDSAADPNHLFCRHPSDFTLFALGQFDDDEGKLIPFITPEPLGKAFEFTPLDRQEVPGPLREEPAPDFDGRLTNGG